MAADRPWRHTRVSAGDAGGELIYGGRAFLGGIVCSHLEGSEVTFTVYDDAEATGETPTGPVVLDLVVGSIGQRSVLVGESPLRLDNGIHVKSSDAETTTTYTVIWAPRSVNE